MAAWSVDAEVFSPDLATAEIWMAMPERLSDPLLTEVASWGMQDEPDGLHAQARLVVDAPDEAAARGVVERLLRELLAGTPARVRALAVTARAADATRAARPRDYESRLVATPWHRDEPTADGRVLRIAWFTGPCPLERVDVEETAQRVTVTLHERHPAALGADGVENAIAAVGIIRCVEVPLTAPLPGRSVYDGATGKRAADIGPADHVQRGMRAETLAVDLETLECLPLPSRTDG